MSRDWDAQAKVDALQETVRRLEKKIQTRSYIGAPSWDDTGEADLFTLGADAFMRVPRGDMTPKAAMDYLPVFLQLKVPRSRMGAPHQEFCYGAMAAAGIPRDQREAVWYAWMAALPPLPDKTSAAQDYAIVGHRGTVDLMEQAAPVGRSKRE